jgi:hypothetical protein
MIINLYDKASALMLVKDFESKVDQEVIMRSLTNIVRKDEHYVEFKDGVADVVLEVYERAFRHVLRVRTERSEALEVSRTSTLFSKVKYCLSNPPLHCQVSDRECVRLRETINAPRLSKPSVSDAAIALGALFTLIGAPILEEAYKRIPMYTNSIVYEGMGWMSGSFLQAGIFAISRFLHNKIPRLFGGHTLTPWGYYPFLKLLQLWSLSVMLGTMESTAAGELGFASMQRGLLHFIWAILPYKQAVLFHSMFNLRYLIMRYMRFSTEARPACLTNALTQQTVCLDDVKMKQFPTQSEFKVRPGQYECTDKDGPFGAWGISGYVATVFRGCTHNEIISMNGRVGKALPMHKTPEALEAVNQAWRAISNRQLPFFKKRCPRPMHPMDFDVWCGTFPPTRRDALLRIRDECKEMPRLTASSFIKKEIAVKDAGSPIFKDPRFIQGCPLELSAAVGPWLRRWTKMVRNRLRPTYYMPCDVLAGKQIIYTCGLSCEDIGKAFENSINCIEQMLEPGDQLVFIEDDQSRFDEHMGQGPFKFFLEKLYKSRLPRRVARLLKRGKSVGVSNLGTKYSVPYTMQSGWPDTSVGDTLVNAAMKRDIHGAGRPWISIICGDDSVTVTTRNELARLGGEQGIIDKYSALGMEVEVKTSSDPLVVEFCSGRFYPANGTYVLMPKTGRILSKICWDMQDRNAMGRKAWLRSIAITLRAYGSIDPLFRALSEVLQQHCGEGRILADRVNEYKAWMQGDLSASWLDVCQYYHTHYQLNESQVNECIRAISASKVGELCEHSILALMAENDL